MLVRLSLERDILRMAVGDFWAGEEQSPALALRLWLVGDARGGTAQRGDGICRTRSGVLCLTVALQFS